MRHAQIAVELARVEAALEVWRGNLATARKDKHEEATNTAYAAVEGLKAEQAALLKRLSTGARSPGVNGPTPAHPGSDGWAQAARALDLHNGPNRIEVDGASLLRPMAALDVTPSSGLDHPSVNAPFVARGQDRRYLYWAFPSGELDEGDMSINDFKMVGAWRAATITAANDTVTLNAHGFSNGDRVIFRGLTGGAGLTAGVTYYVRDAAANTFKLAVTATGAAIDVTSDATAAEILSLESEGRTVTGAVERDPMAKTDKASVGLGIELADDKVRQFAALVEDVPAKLFDVVSVLEAFLRSELRYQHERAIDAHTVARILAAQPFAGSVGADLIAKVRNAIATMREVGGNPQLLAVSPETAATLDLTKHGADEYLFVTTSSGSSSPLWSLLIAEVPGLLSPLVIDPTMLGVIYIARGTITADPYTGLKQNLVRIRAEVDGLFHVRNGLGAYVIT